MDQVLIDMRNENKWIREAFNNADMVTIDTILNKIEDLLDEVNELNEQIDEYRHIEDNREAWEDIRYEKWKEENGW